MRHHRSLVFFRRGRGPLDAGAADLLLSLFSLLSALPILGEPVEE